jgi:hypothetical protein
MRNLMAAALCLLAVGLPRLQAQALPSAQVPPLSYDLYYVLPGEAGSGGADVGFATPAIADAGDLSSFDLMAKYSPIEGVEVGGRATLGFLNDQADDLSAVTLGAKYALAEMSAVSFNVSALNGADELGISAGLLSSMVLGEYGVNSHILFAFLDGYTPDGALIDVLVQPVLPLGDKAFAYLDIMVATDTEMPADRLSLQLGPNLDYEVMPGLMLNGGIEFSLYSGDQITHDTDLGVVISLFKTAALW